MQNTLREFRGRIAIGNADLICNTTYSEDSIYKGRNCNLKLKSSFTKVQQIIKKKSYYSGLQSSTETRNGVRTVKITKK